MCHHLRSDWAWLDNKLGFLQDQDGPGASAASEEWKRIPAFLWQWLSQNQADNTEWVCRAGGALMRTIWAEPR